MLVPVRLVVTEFDPELFVDDEFEVLDEPDSSLEAVELSQADKPSARTASDVGMNESRGCIGTPPGMHRDSLEELLTLLRKQCKPTPTKNNYASRPF